MIAHWPTMLASAGFSMLLSAGLAPAAIAFAKKRRIVSDPDKLRFYVSERPLLGHVVLFCAFFIPLGLAFALGLFGDEYFYQTEQLERMATGLFLGGLFLLISATRADVKNDPGELEWLYIIAAALLLYFFDVRFSVLKLPFLGELNTSVWGPPLLIAWTLLVVSIVELLDFFEGVAGAVVAAASLAYFLLYLFSAENELFATFLFGALFGASAGLLPYLVRKKILFGKSGNKILGFIFAAGTVIARRKETTGQFILFPIAVLLFIIVTVNFLFLERQFHPVLSSRRENGGEAPESDNGS